MTACDQCGLKKISLHLKEGHVSPPPPQKKKNPFKNRIMLLYNGYIVIYRCYSSNSRRNGLPWLGGSIPKPSHGDQLFESVCRVRMYPCAMTFYTHCLVFRRRLKTDVSFRFFNARAAEPGGGGQVPPPPPPNFQHPKSALFLIKKCPFFEVKSALFRSKKCPFCWGKGHFPHYLSP